jgi:hypothetical protein
MKTRHQWNLVLLSTFGIESHDVVDILNNWITNMLESSKRVNNEPTLDVEGSPQ